MIINANIKAYPEPILGICDSGIGGLSVVLELQRHHPDISYIYLGDTANSPYGNHAPEEIIKFTREMLSFLQNRGNLYAAIIACNTASAVGLPVIAQEYDFPIFGMLAPASRLAVRSTLNKRIGVVATQATVNSLSYSRAINEQNNGATVIELACPELASAIEDPSSTRHYLTRLVFGYCEPLQEEGIDTLVLGCTHYPLIQDIFEQLYPDLNIINPAAEVVKEFFNQFPETPLGIQQHWQSVVTSDGNIVYKDATGEFWQRLNALTAREP